MSGRRFAGENVGRNAVQRFPSVAGKTTLQHLSHPLLTKQKLFSDTGDRFLLYESPVAGVHAVAPAGRRFLLPAKLLSNVAHQAPLPPQKSVDYKRRTHRDVPVEDGSAKVRGTGENAKLVIVGFYLFAQLLNILNIYLDKTE